MDPQKQGKAKTKFLKFLPKSVSSAYLHSAAPYSPNRDKRSSEKFKTHGGRCGFSGPLMIPEEARRRLKNGSSSFGSIDNQEEPTSPKVSCMGQIKQKKQQHEEKKQIKRAGLPPRDSKSKPSAAARLTESTGVVIKKRSFVFKRMFSSVNPTRKSDAGHDRDINNDEKVEALPERAPSLSQMSRFASGRGQAFANFDWQTAVAAARVAPRDGDDNGRNYYSDEEREHSDDQEDDYVGIAFSAPLTIGGSPGNGDVALQPRKEINLWKRRTMAPPSPLQLKPVVKAS